MASVCPSGLENIRLLGWHTPNVPHFRFVNRWRTPNAPQFVSFPPFEQGQSVFVSYSISSLANMSFLVCDPPLDCISENNYTPMYLVIFFSLLEEPNIFRKSYNGNNFGSLGVAYSITFISWAMKRLE